MELWAAFADEAGRREGGLILYEDEEMLFHVAIT